MYPYQIKVDDIYKLPSGAKVKVLMKALVFRGEWVVPVELVDGNHHTQFAVSCLYLVPYNPPPTKDLPQVEYQGVYVPYGPHDGSCYGQLGPKKSSSLEVEDSIQQFMGSSKTLRLAGILTFRKGLPASLQEVE